jgi:hypothetical protein
VNEQPTAELHTTTSAEVEEYLKIRKTTAVSPVTLNIIEGLDSIKDQSRLHLTVLLAQHDGRMDLNFVFGRARSTIPRRFYVIMRFAKKVGSEAN